MCSLRICPMQHVLCMCIVKNKSKKSKGNGISPAVCQSCKKWTKRKANAIYTQKSHHVDFAFLDHVQTTCQPPLYCNEVERRYIYDRNPEDILSNDPWHSCTKYFILRKVHPTLPTVDHPTA